MELRSKSALLATVPYAAPGWDYKPEKKRRGRRPRVQKESDVSDHGRSFEFTNPTFACGLISELYQLYLEGICCDVVLSSGDYQTSVHRIVLVASSEYFKSVFTSSVPAKDFIVLSSDISSEALKLVICYMYTGLLSLNPENVLSVFRAVTRLRIKAAISLCNQFLSCNGASLDSSSFPLLTSGLPFHLDQVNDIVIKEELVGIDEAEFSDKVSSGLFDVHDVYDGNIPDHTVVDEVQVLHVDYLKRRTRTKRRQINDETVVDLCRGASVKLEVSCPETIKDRGNAEQRRIASEATLSVTGSKLEQNCSRRKSSSKVMMCLPKPRKRRRGSYIHARKSSGVVKKRAEPKKKKVATIGRILLADGSAFKCRVCNAGFERHAGLTLHLKFHHEISIMSSAVKSYRRLLRSATRQVGQHCLLEKQISTLQGSHDLKYVCSTCNRTFGMRARLLSHLMKHHPSLNLQIWQHKSVSFGSNLISEKNRFLRPCVYRCRHCKRPFAHRSTMSSHCLVDHKRIKREDCNGDEMPRLRQTRMKWSCKETDCNAVCSGLRDLKRHMATKHPNVTFSCPDCRFSCQVDRVFQKHRNQRHGKKQVCHLCGKTCPKLSLLKQHMYIHHRIKDPTLKLFQCAFEGCTYECCSKNRLADHCSRHNLDKSLKCEECGKTFKHALGLQRHISTIHHGIRPFICDQCGMGFGTEGELKTHVARHTKNKPYACGHCSYRTSAKVNLQYHLFSRHQIKTGLREQKLVILKCDQCDFTTSRKGRLEDHVKKHRNIRDIPCPECGKLFVTKKNLYGHTVTVHRPKTLHCAYCNYSSALLSAFKDHVRIMHTHRHEKRYECPICRFRSATSGNCRKHIQRTHKEFGINPRYVGAPRKSDLMRAGKEDSVVNKEDEETLNLSCKEVELCVENK